MEVTDGWYGVRASLDAPLADLLQRGRLRVGAPPCALTFSNIVGSAHHTAQSTVSGGALSDVLMMHQLCMWIAA